MKLDLAIEALSQGWLNGRELLDAVRAMSGETAAYDSANACARNAKAKVARLGLWWQYMEVNYEESTGGSEHRLWTCTEEGIPRPHRAWQQGDAVVHLESPSGAKKLFMREKVGRAVRTREEALAIMAAIGPRPPEPTEQRHLP